MKKIIFVCMGNICRSPSAEAVMKHKLNERGKTGEYFVDSAGTIDYHEGEEADARMKKHAEKRGYQLESIARGFRDVDFEKFDHILVMDDSNLDAIRKRDKSGKYNHKIRKLTDFSSNGYKSVPDPYYGGAAGFENVLDILEDSIENFINSIENKDD